MGMVDSRVFRARSLVCVWLWVRIPKLALDQTSSGKVAMPRKIASYLIMSDYVSDSRYKS